MTPLRSPTLRLRARGPLACFTRPELKVERVSYPVMTPSAARGLLEAVLWKPAIQWRIERIHVLKPIRFIAFRRNEVSHRAVSPAAAVVRDGGTVSPYFADDDRAQRNTLALREVDYLIEARFEMTERAGPLDNLTKFVEIFERRVVKGQTFHQPYFGCREFDAEVLPAEGAPAAEDVTQELGLMLWDVEYAPQRNRPVFFQARLDRGILEVPADPEAMTAAAGGAV
jgi:CRISPR-associated protein Cas5d